MKINYPIKYAAMPIIEQNGFSYGFNELERNCDVVCYIVSKCYLTKEITKYSESGRISKKYEVVFPYQESKFNEYIRVIPEFNLISGDCFNITTVDNIFDTYDEALNFVNKMNEQLCQNTWVLLPFTDDLFKKIEDKKNVFNTRLTRYKNLERKILENTEDLSSDKTKLLDNVLKINNGVTNRLNCSIYDILKLFSSEDFIIVSTSIYDINREKSFDKVINEVDNLLVHFKDDFNLKLVNKEDIAINDNSLIFYTTESLDDILNSYKKYPTINLDDELILQRKKKS